MMKQFTKTARFIILISLIFGATVAARRKRRDASTELEAFVDKYMNWRFTYNPEYASDVGVHDYEDRITVLTEQSFVQQEMEARGLLNEADMITMQGLSSQERTSLRLLRASLQTFIDGFAFRKHSRYNMISPMESPPGYFNGLFGSCCRYETESDIQNALTRMGLLDTYVQQRIALLSDAISAGTTAHETSLTGLIEKIEAEIVADVTQSSPYNSVFNRTKPESVDSATWDSLKIQGQTITKDEMIPAWTQFRDFLDTTYRAATRPNEGVGSLVNGSEYYQACLKWHLTVDMTADEVHQIGLGEVTRIQALMEQEKVKAGFDGTLQEFIAHLKSLPDNFFQTEEEMLNGYQEAIDEIKGYMPSLVNNGPVSDCKVVKNPDPQGVLGMYSSPTEERPYGVFWANVFDPQNKPKSDMIALTIHEAEPGHHTQNGYVFERLGHIPTFRRNTYSTATSSAPFEWPYFTSYGEGWALYSEALGEQIGIYNDKWPHSLFGRYASEIFRAVRLVVDTGIHSKGWSKQQAMDYIAKYTTFTTASIEIEVNRYISWPGQACAYKIGQLKIESLKAKAEREIGNTFDQKEFHELILRFGRVPLDVLEVLVDEWIMDKKETNNPSEYLSQIMDDYMTWRMKENPEYGTRMGKHDRDDRITEYTEAIFIRQRNEAEVLLQRTEFVQYDRLTKQEKINYKVLVDFLQTFIEGFQFRKLTMYNMLSPLDSPVSQWEAFFYSLILQTEDDYRLRAFKRLQAIETWVDQRIHLMSEAITLGTTVHETSLTGLLEKIDSEIVTRAEDSLAWRSLFNRTKPGQLSDNAWNQLKLEGANMTMQIWVPAVSRFRYFLSDTYMLNTRPQEGIGSLPNGQEAYQSCLRYYMTVDMTADQVHQIGLQEVERIAGLMEKEMAKYGHTGTLQEFISVIKNDQKNYYYTEEEMLDGYRQIIANTRAQLQMFLNNMPESECRVVQNMDPQGIAGSYSGPSESRPYGVFRANVYDPETRPKSEMPALTMHEAEPGHHTQIAYHYEKLTDLPTFRRNTYTYPRSASPFNWPRFASCSEGWALYAEALGEEMGVYEEDYALFGRYESEIFRACRLVVDTGMHAKGWTKQDAMWYMGNYTTSSPAGLEIEINRYISWPGQACAYKIGQLKIEELRDRWLARLGNLFDLREFHDQILQLGRVPLSVIEEFIDEWGEGIQKMQENKEQAEKLYADFLEWRLVDDPEYGTTYGIHTYDHTVSQWTEEHFINQLETATRFLDRTRRISRDGLSDLDQLHLAILEEHLGFFISGFAYRRYSTYNALDPLEPPTDHWAGTLSSMKYNTMSDYDKAFSRLSQLGTYVDQRLKLLNESIANKLTLHRYSLTGIVEKMENEIVQSANKSTYFKIMFDRDTPTGISAEQWTQLQDDASGIIMGIVVPGWQRFKIFLENEYVPNTREFEGVWNLEGGLDFYQACLKFHTTTDLTPLEIHQIGLSEVARISGEMEKIMQDNNFSGTLQEYIAEIKKDPDQYYTTGDEKIQGYQSIIDDMHSKLDTILLNIPNMPIEVVASTNPQSAGGSYSTPPLDGSRNGTFTANVFNVETKPKLDMPSLTLHEAEPGHHTQLTYSIDQGIPTFRAIQEYGIASAVPFGWPYYTGFVEGWALYAESLGVQMGAYDEDKWPHSQFGMLASEMYRACRLVVDTGIHAFGWNKEQAANYFRTYTTSSNSSIDNEMNRYISWPGQATGYKIGQLKILEMRQKAIDDLGEQYDIREFNDELLKIGAAPLSLMESRIDSWIASKQATTPTTPAVTTPTSTVKTTTQGNQTGGAGTPYYSACLTAMLTIISLITNRVDI